MRDYYGKYCRLSLNYLKKFEKAYLNINIEENKIITIIINIIIKCVAEEFSIIVFVKALDRKNILPTLYR
jgi:hypothetical protein